MPPYATLKFDIDSLTVADFRDMSIAGKLILRPEYQRQAVWPERAKVSLMETILLGYPIPEIYLAYETSPDGYQTVSVVDGQQRLTALLDYLENRYALDELEDKDISEKYEGKYFRDLPAEVRTEFFQYRFPIRRLSNLDEEFVRAIFARVNRVNMVLTAQELRNALLPGPFFDFLKDCAAHDLSTVSGVFSGERRKRGGDLEFYAEVFGTCIFGLSNKKAELDERYDKFSADFEEYRDRSADFLDMLTVLAETVKWQGQVRWSNIIDLFTLLHVCWGFHERLKSATGEELLGLRSVLDIFQRTVSAYKRDDASGSADLITALSEQLKLPEPQVTSMVRGYISGIRNSSDLGSRRTRSRELRAVVMRQLEIEEPS
ncbi:DUF262 domain-containing protein [Mycobacteroides abscessus subsp. abscessus]|uniref:DUF262 domain-containing protein n=1 Tax=Mycobacteroides abscessus TaxID=36809 RepID=UPI0005DD1657|nr:DUF262 domain-containing protein [Mycobacteroides abscessus]AWG50884.1 DUF262 domain-containing protein [Mycobacteroides abscessus]MBN7551274.1 DUF262 domain-containing protein [Mycobacteroides abscessus subsp. abscessus]MDM2173481.1 DUF262 domain-containing protein [Mycobacteroides abscessus]MDM2176248.1 DUF262 domain-containing protein [Mycobacteroides abscessus]MDM2204813.1 DUF262 domain-containing protein [Mycobacteroides abscessus]